MCGIVGYIGMEEAALFLLHGLQRLEYRGYDSAGVAVYNETGPCGEVQGTSQRFRRIFGRRR